MSAPGVLIVGAGPTGLTAALTLAKNGVAIRIIEKSASFHMEQRGPGIHPRTLEVFNYLDVLPDIWENGMELLPSQRYKMPGGVEPLGKPVYLVQPSEPTPSIPYANPRVVGQCYTERILRSHLAKYGYEVELNTELHSIEQAPEHVTVTTVKREGDKETTVSASYRWVIAADGGRSTIRKQLGMSFEGQRLPERMILGELDLKGLDRESWHRWNDMSDRTKAMVIFRPTETIGRYWFVIGGNIDHEDALSSRDALLRTIHACIERDDLEFGELHYMLEYRPSVRMVEKLDEGRVFLAGDAAHVHSPLGGQGLNTSVQDAFNIAWKLALVERGFASRSLLSTYSEERLPVIKRMIEETKEVYKRALEKQTNPGTNQASDAEAQSPMVSEEMKQLGVNYRWSSVLVDERHAVSAENAKQETFDAYGALGGDGLHAGDRAPQAPGLVPLKCTGSSAKIASLFDIIRPIYHTVLVFGQDPIAIQEVLTALRAYPVDLIRSAVIHPQQGRVATLFTDANLVLKDVDGFAYAGYGCPPDGTAVIVVRPDGVVGAIAANAQGVKQYFDRVLTVRQ